jgi:hypothetical protein
VSQDNSLEQLEMDAVVCDLSEEPYQNQSSLRKILLNSDGRIQEDFQLGFKQIFEVE